MQKIACLPYAGAALSVLGLSMHSSLEIHAARNYLASVCPGRSYSLSAKFE